MMNNRKFTREETASIGIGAMIVFIALILVAAVASAVIIQTGEKLQQNAQQTGSDTQREIAGKISLKTVRIVDTTQVRLFFESSPGSDVLDVTDLAWQVACTNPDPNADGTAVTTDNPGYQFVAGVFGDGIAGNAGTVANNDGTGNDDDDNYAYLEDVMGPTDDDEDGDFGDSNDDDSEPTNWGVAPVDDGAGGLADDSEGDVSNEALTILPGENYVIMLDLAQGIAGNDCGINDLSINDEITLWIHVEGGGSTYETLTITDKTVGSELV